VPDDLLNAIARRDLATVSALLASGADPNIRAPDASGFTALQTAIHELSEDAPLDIVNLLIAHGAEVDRRDHGGDSTPLLMAVFRRQQAVVEVLLKAGADPNVRGSEGDTPLCVAAEKGEHEVATLLLEHGAIKTIDERGGIPQCWTPLGVAASQGDLEMIDLLLGYGANPNAPDPDGDTPLQRAEDRWHHVRERLEGRR
jgi:ankyrin repeat protein